MPIERRDSTTQIRAVIIAVVAVAIAALLGFSAIRSQTHRGSSVVKPVGDSRFALNAASVSANIVKDGPVLFPDAGSGGQRRPIYVYHEGTDPKTNWSAFVALPPGAPSDCFVVWHPDTKRLVAPCNGATYPPNGQGLTPLRTEVTKGGQLLINLSQPSR